MTADPIRNAFEEWTKGASPLQARILLFERVRDIPYAYPASRDPVDVLTMRRGSCSGKHRLLGALFAMLGLRSRHVICKHRFNESPIPFPEEMQAALRKNELFDLHDFLQIEIDGEWIDVDATWERSLREFGFPVNEDWDGKSPMLLSVVPEDVQVAEDPERAKEEMLSKLSPRQRSLRKEFLVELSNWVAELTREQVHDGEAG